MVSITELLKVQYQEKRALEKLMSSSTAENKQEWAEICCQNIELLHEYL